MSRSRYSEGKCLGGPFGRKPPCGGWGRERQNCSIVLELQCGVNLCVCVRARACVRRRHVATKMLPRFSRAKSANYATLLSQALQDADPDQIDANHVNQIMQSSQAYKVSASRRDLSPGRYLQKGAEGGGGGGLQVGFSACKGVTKRVLSVHTHHHD